MKKCFGLAALIAALSIPQFAVAADDNDPKAQPKVKKKVALQTTGSAEVKSPAEGKLPADIRFEVDTLRVGRVVTVGPDGKKVILEFRGQPPKEVLDKLDKDIRERTQKTATWTVRDGGGDVGGKMTVVIDNDGQRQELVLPAPPNPDVGKRLYFNFSDVLKKAGDKLPPEPKQALEAVAQAVKAQEQDAVAEAAKAQDAVAQAVKAQEALARVVKDQQQEAIAQAAKAQEAYARAVKAYDQVLSRGHSKASDEINAKLDKILDRLERVEKDIQAIKAKNDK
ncbi:MAG: hypothetical protein ACLP9L_16120 [Thermoguttaceae bacterium]